MIRAEPLILGPQTLSRLTQTLDLATDALIAPGPAGRHIAQARLHLQKAMRCPDARLSQVYVAAALIEARAALLFLRHVA